MQTTSAGYSIVFESYTIYDVSYVAHFLHELAYVKVMYSQASL